MIYLGIDPAIATCGYAVVRRPIEVLELGVIPTPIDDDLDISVSDARRIALVGGTLLDVCRRHGVTRIGAEQRLSHGAKRAIATQALCWGALIQLAIATGASLDEIVAKAWQNEVVPGVMDREKDDRYPLIERALADFIGPQIDKVPKGLRTHALDGLAVALCTALRPQLCRRVINRASTLPVERTEGATT